VAWRIVGDATGLNRCDMRSRAVAIAVCSMAITDTYGSWYRQTNNYSTNSVAWASCFLGATFKPVAAATRSAKSSIETGATRTPYSVALSGTRLVRTLATRLAKFSPIDTEPRLLAGACVGQSTTLNPSSLIVGDSFRALGLAHTSQVGSAPRFGFFPPLARGTQTVAVMKLPPMSNLYRRRS